MWQVDELANEVVELSDIVQHSHRVVTMVNNDVIRLLAAGGQVPGGGEKKQDFSRKICPEVGESSVGVLDKRAEGCVVDDGGLDQVHGFAATCIVRDDPLLPQHHIAKEGEDQYIGAFGSSESIKIIAFKKVFVGGSYHA